MDELARLRERRAYECRLTPDRALQTIGEAEEFLRDRGLLTRTADCALPSLYEACHEEPYQAGGQGFSSWPATKWPWAAELAERAGVSLLHVHRGKNLLVAPEILALIDPICRAELARMEQEDPGWHRLLRFLAQAGPSLTEDVQLELGLSARELKSLRAPLERCGAVVSRQVVLDAAAGEGHVHRSELARWDQAFPDPAPGEADLARLLAAAIAAAVLAPERELVRWFSWRWLYSPGLVDQLVETGQIRRPALGWVVAAG
jgi:hypothetical protein